MNFAAFVEKARTTPPAIVFDVSYACGLGIVRDLGRHGVPVLALDARASACGLRSRYAAARLCPDPVDGEEAFLAWLEALGRELPQRAVVFPSHDQFIWPLSRHAERLSQWFIIPFSRWDVMEKLYDKRAQMEAAWRASVDTPRTVFIDSHEDLEKAIAEVPFPAIFKPVDSLAFKQRFHRHVLEIATPEELAEVYAKADDVGTLILQERIPGGDEELFTVGSYLDVQSQPLAVFSGHKLRQHPRGAGSCRLGVSKWDQRLADDALRLLKELRYHGVTQVEFKRDPRDGRYCLMEVNARHWMWHSLAAACGVNLSLAAYRDAIGKPFTAPRQKDGPKWVITNKDLPLAVREIAKRQLSLGAYLRSVRGVRIDGVHSLRDPLPGLVNLRSVLGQILGGNFGRRVES